MILRLLIVFAISVSAALAQFSWPQFTFTNNVIEPVQFYYYTASAYNQQTGTWTPPIGFPANMLDSYFQTPFGGYVIDAPITGQPPAGFYRLSFRLLSSPAYEQTYGYSPYKLHWSLAIVYVLISPGVPPIPYNPLAMPDPRIDPLPKIATPWGLWAGGLPLGKFWVYPNQWTPLVPPFGGQSLETYSYIDVPVALTGQHFTVQFILFQPFHSRAMLSRPFMVDL